ncbi:MAG: hypothetical protein EA412_00080 [Chitinophagaceae bacterium]|nr:MAG: hypothetical protein EA412_00080 [Chitinophagaceae bacterium]
MLLKPEIILSQSSGDTLTHSIPDTTVYVPSDSSGGGLMAGGSCDNSMEWTSIGLNIVKCPPEGNVGIGVSFPLAKLHVEGGNTLLDERVGINTNANFGTLSISAAIEQIGTTVDIISPDDPEGWANQIRFSEGVGGVRQALRHIIADDYSSNNLVISPGYNLESGANRIVEVRGKLTACEIEVELESWCDFVFEENYQLMPLNELETFIKTHRHLPQIPSEEEVVNNRLNVGQMHYLQMLKIEELTLYTIEQQREIEALRAKKDDLKQLRREVEMLKELFKAVTVD